ncbi:MAG: DUF305 domain-containing protein [Bradyrhizobiaceae bacterium]|nr:DUF305 domain-containing protein [Bradyrhizobiaceae bacterium]
MSNRKTLFLALAVAGGVTVGGAAVAQSMQHGPMHGGGHDMPGGMHASMHDKGGMQHGGGHGHGAAPAARSADESASSLAFRAANEKMHRDMAIAYSGDADADFVRGMIPHHQGAIDMAKIVIAFGKDPEVRKLAEEIVKAQEGEIALMRAWLANKGK